MDILNKTLRLLSKDRKRVHDKARLETFIVNFQQRKRELLRLTNTEQDRLKSEAYKKESQVIDVLISKTRQRIQAL